MQRSPMDLPAVFEGPQGTWRMTEWEGMNIEYMSFRQEVDPAQLLKSAPDSLCPCPHWGYVIKGRVRFVFADHEEICNTGDVCYVAPGHRPIFAAGTEFVAVSQAEAYRPIIDAIKQQLAARVQQTAG
jgi:hypothetical protein